MAAEVDNTWYVATRYVDLPPRNRVDGSTAQPCPLCGEHVAVSPSGSIALYANPKLRLICHQCFHPIWVCTPPDERDIGDLLPGQAEEIRHIPELHTKAARRKLVEDYHGDQAP